MNRTGASHFREPLRDRFPLSRKGGAVRAILYKIGRVLQLIGLLLLPLAIAGNLSPEPDNQLSLGQSMALSSAGVVVFIVGYLLQQAGRPR
jgi:hypothetical protein